MSPAVDPEVAGATLPGQVAAGGLSAAEAAARLVTHGRNELEPPPPRRWWSRVLTQLTDPMIIVLLVAGALTTAIGDVPDTVIIALVVVMNTCTGVVQEQRAEHAIAELGRLTAPTSLVVRDGRAHPVPAAEIVPGDVVLLRAGDQVPADGDLAAAESFALDESAMTGESMPVGRRAGEAVTAGTLVVRGRGVARVTATGETSGLGRLARLMREAPDRRTPLQARMARLSQVLVIGVLTLTWLVVVIGLVLGRSVTEMLVVGASLAVAAVPESLPAVMAVSLAMGAHRMAQRSAVVRRLPAVETLGSVSVIATDKTGTLTEGRMTVDDVWTPPDAPADLETLLRDVVVCNDAALSGPAEDPVLVGDPLETALLRLARTHGYDVPAIRRTWTRIGEEPFDAATRSMTTRHRTVAGEGLTVLKGAPEVVLARIPDGAAARRAADDLAGRGCRVLAVADAPTSGSEPVGLRLVGLVAVVDPPREAAAHVVAACHRAGVRVVLITGDHPFTAADVAGRVGIPSGPGQCLVAAGLSPDELAARAVDRNVFARVLPEQKVEVVRALQAEGEVVAMLGDGVNDAPALRHADIGVAAGRGGTEVARQAADLVLLDDDLGTVVAAVEEGRRIFANLRAFLTYAVSGGLAEVAVMLVGPFVGMPLPLLPAQILWINLLTHGLTGVAFSGEPADPADMERPPVPPGEPILASRHVTLLGVATTVLTAASLVAAALAPSAEARTALFLALGLGQLGVAVALRSRHARRGWAGQGLLLAVVTAAALQVLGAYVGVLQRLLHTHTPSGSTLLVSLVAAVLPGVAVALTRRLRQRSPSIS